MDDKMDDDSKEKLNKNKSEISKGTKIVKKTIAQNKTYNILISNYFTIEERGELSRICHVLPKKSEKLVILTNFVFLKKYGIFKKHF